LTNARKGKGSGVGRGKVDLDLNPESRIAEGIDAEGEELGASGETSGLALPSEMVDRLRVKLAVWSVAESIQQKERLP
jgi:hypothetical protein